MLPLLKCSLKPMPLTLCPSKARHDLGSITSPHHGTDHLLNKNGVEGLPNVHKDDGGRKLSQLSPGTEKAARHDGKFGTSAPDSSRLRHSSRQWKPRHCGCTQHDGVHLSWTAGVQNSSRVAWREWPWLARNGCHIASLPQHRSTFLRHFGTQDAERPAISLAASCNQFRRESIGPKTTTGLGLGKNVKSIFPFALRAWQYTRVRRRPGEKNRGCPLVCLHLFQMLRLTEFGTIFSKLLHKLSLMLIGLRLMRDTRGLPSSPIIGTGGRKERFLRPTSLRTADHVAAQSPVSCRRAMESA